MNEDEKYLFDLNGYLVLKEILNDQEVKRLNAAIDVHSDEMQEIDRSLGFKILKQCRAPHGVWIWEECYRGISHTVNRFENY